MYNQYSEDAIYNFFTHSIYIYDGDWIVTDDADEKYICSDDDFGETYIISPELTDDVRDRIDAIKMEILGRDD